MAPKTRVESYATLEGFKRPRLGALS